MATELEYILHNIKESFDGKPWYGVSLIEKLKEIPWKIENDNKYQSKSIAVLVQHIINWRIFLLRKLAGDEDYDLIIDSKEDWTLIHINNQQEWESLIHRLRQTQSELIEKLSKANEALLEKLVPSKKYTFFPVLNSISQHDIYHLGQISMLVSMNKD